MKTILVGSVDSSRVVLEEMIAQGCSPELVFSLDEAFSANVSGYAPIHELAAQYNIPCIKFRKINDPENVKLVKDFQPDYLFVVGLSQIISKELISAATHGAIGFHPTPLPKFRGRAAIVWQMLLGVRETKCTLFMIDEGMDSGDILGQEDYIIEESDYADDVNRKVCDALRRLLKRIIPQMQNGTLRPIKQNEVEATYLLKRVPEDGLINWHDPAEKIHRLVRATSKPYPGAFSNYDGKHKIIFWRADLRENGQYTGIPGQIANITEDTLEIVCVDGLLRVYEYDNIDKVKLIAGHKFK